MIAGDCQGKKTDDRISLPDHCFLLVRVAQKELDLFDTTKFVYKPTVQNCKILQIQLK